MFCTRLSWTRAGQRIRRPRGVYPPIRGSPPTPRAAYVIAHRPPPGPRPPTGKEGQRGPGWRMGKRAVATSRRASARPGVCAGGPAAARAPSGQRHGAAAPLAPLWSNCLCRLRWVISVLVAAGGRRGHRAGVLALFHMVIFFCQDYQLTGSTPTYYKYRWWWAFPLCSLRSLYTDKPIGGLRFTSYALERYGTPHYCALLYNALSLKIRSGRLLTHLDRLHRWRCIEPSPACLPPPIKAAVTGPVPRLHSVVARGPSPQQQQPATARQQWRLHARTPTKSKTWTPCCRQKARGTSPTPSTRTSSTPASPTATWTGCSGAEKSRSSPNAPTPSTTRSSRSCCTPSRRPSSSRNMAGTLQQAPAPPVSRTSPTRPPPSTSSPPRPAAPAPLAPLQAQQAVPASAAATIRQHNQIPPLSQSLYPARGSP